MIVCRRFIDSNVEVFPLAIRGIGREFGTVVITRALHSSGDLRAISFGRHNDSASFRSFSDEIPPLGMSDGGVLVLGIRSVGNDAISCALGSCAKTRGSAIPDLIVGVAQLMPRHRAPISEDFSTREDFAPLVIGVFPGRAIFAGCVSAAARPIVSIRRPGDVLRKTGPIVGGVL